MNIEEIVMVSISEFLDVEVHKDTETLDLAAKIEIVQKRIVDKTKNKQKPFTSKNNFEVCEYEMFFSSNPNDIVKIDGWIPVQTDKIDKKERISEYIEIGLLRKI
ncbi:hypothetical protein [Aquimarina muelleri]|uniref:Uncharacterized protein n=1 Tax=Aquimarina muelleri TaxID=279356 RepID=A0A918JXQ8_9FLAO|nr:hypothetical protein [Aquimarina muelleri]MCX2763272.1 hypothetical protein [Aquimarina muelleri]GGX27511.1 hypothetical protein GCM10007384_31000 [Aquimarina muelleri]